jgi:hypothetical protein
MSIPGFSAESSLYRAKFLYHSATRQTHVDRVRPAQLLKLDEAREWGISRYPRSRFFEPLCRYRWCYAVDQDGNPILVRCC